MADLNIGGQAVIEGVMMRSKSRVATAVRLPDGEIVVRSQTYTSLAHRYPLLNIPILRGAVAFLEMTAIGIKTLNFSAEVAMKESDEAETGKRPGKSSSTLSLTLTVVISLAFGIALFFFTPLAIASLFGISQDAVAFNLLAGGIRLAMFVLYVWGMSFFKDFKRLFEYHGAEHKAIYTYEMGDTLLPERAKQYTRFHPRCGTSFILIVALVAILTYAISDTLFALWLGHPPSLIARFILHLLLLPLVAGSAYELLKLSGRTRTNAVTRVLIQPGLWLQRITTQEPDASQLEVAIVALESALGVEQPTFTSRSLPVS